VHAVRPGGERHIEPVVDENRHGHGASEGTRELHELAGRRVLEAQLHGRDPARHGGTAHRHDVAPGEQAVVGDEQEPQGLR